MLTSLSPVVPRPTDAGLPYEDVALKTSDGVSIRAYVIPVRRRVVPLEELRGLSQKRIRERGMLEQEEWAKVKDSDDAIEVRWTGCVFAGFLLINSTQSRGPQSSCSMQMPVRVAAPPESGSTLGNVGHRVPLARKFVSELGCNVFMLSYRGWV